METFTGLVVLVLVVSVMGATFLAGVVNAAVATMAAAAAGVGRLITTAMVTMTALLLVTSASDRDEPAERVPQVVVCPGVDAECTRT